MDVIALNTGPPVDTDAALIAGVRGSMPLDNAPWPRPRSDCTRPSASRQGAEPTSDPGL